MGTRHRPSVRGMLFAALAFGALALAGCSTLPASTLDTYGDHARRIYELLVPIAWMALAVFLVVEGALIYTVLRYRRRAAGTMPRQVHGNTKVEIMWTIAPALIVVIISVLTFRTQAANSQMPADALQVRAIGHQWWFEFRYPEQGAELDPADCTKSDPKECPKRADLVTASDLYIPVGRPVTVQLEAVDVMHNFWVPKLAGKTYMIPGKINYLTFTAEQAGIYRAVCAEFCGEAHALMRFRVIALEQAEYDSWVAQHRVAPVIGGNGVLGGDPNRGKELFLNARNLCITCHVIDGTGAKGIVGPNLSYYGSRQTIAAGIMPYSPENLERWLKHGYELKPGNLMSRVLTRDWIAANLTDQDIKDLVAYLDSMKVSIASPPAR